MNLFIKSRNGIDIINLANVAYLKADGNYTDFYFLDGKVKTQLSTLSFFDDAITSVFLGKKVPSPFYRMGRSYLVNINHITSVNLQNLTLSFNTDKMRPISTSKGNLKGLRAHIVKTYDI